MKSCKKISSKEAKKYSNWFFSLLPWPAQMTQTEEFIFQNVAYRPTIYKTGVRLEKCTQLKRYMRDYDICQKSPFCLLYPSTIYGSLFQDLSKSFKQKYVFHSWKSFQKELHLPFEVKPSISSHSKPHTRSRTRHLKCFVLNTVCSKTKRLRRLLRDLVWGL